MFSSVYLKVRTMVCWTHSLRPQPAEVMASLKYTAPSSSMRLDDRSMISRDGFSFSISARGRAPSRVTRLLQKQRCHKEQKEGKQTEQCVGLFLPAQVQKAQAAVELQALSQPLHPTVGHPHLPQVELHQAAVHHQHL